MFGKPSWFRPKTHGWGLTPVTWQGWGYTGAWASAIAVPFTLLIWRHQPLEAATWMTFGLAAMTYDVREILRSIRGTSCQPAATAAAGQQDDVLYIGESTAGAAVATPNYRLQVRR